jgi:hypothetical protein
LVSIPNRSDGLRLEQHIAGLLDGMNPPIIAGRIARPFKQESA